MSTVLPFPLARSKRASGIASQLSMTRTDRRQKRLTVLLEDEFRTLVRRGIDSQTALTEVERLGERAIFLLNARSITESDKAS
ncbi:MAG: hypothetical protein AAGH38_06215 [Pseudomonadota bacterium]